MILRLIIFDQDYSDGCLTRIGLDQCIVLLMILVYHFTSAIKLLLLLVC